MSDVKIAVIGAGAAGLSAAYQLKKMGYTLTTVFEKEAQVGGKICTYFYKGKPYELGAVWTTSDYKTVSEISEELGVERYPVPQLDLMMANGRVLDLVRYVFQHFNPVTFSIDLFAFWRFCSRNQRIKKSGFHGLDSDFHLKLDELARKHGFLATTQTMAPTMSACGYGFYEEVPAQYWMKLMVILLNFAARGGHYFNNLKSYKNGYQTLWQEVAEQVDVRLSTPVTSIKRYSESGRDRVEIAAGGKTEVFDKVLVCAPLETAEKFMDLSDLEREMFSKIRTIKYVVTVAAADTKVHTAFVKNITPNRLGHVNAALKFHKDSNVCVYFQMVENSTTKEQALEVLKADLEEVGVKLHNIHLQKVWDYFPHVVSEDLQDGYYEKLDEMQGDRGTYYAGSLLSFETVEHTAKFAKDLVERFF